MATPVAELDFDNIKANIITFLESQTEFQDYDFTGSGMNVLMDTLAYATHYMGIYTNMTFNEMFLETALLRSSVVSTANELGYFPKQFTASAAQIDLTVDLSAEGSPPVNVTVDKGTRFTGLYEDGESYIFSSDETHILTDLGGNVYQGTVSLVQGTYVTDKFTYDSNTPETQMVLTNTQVDVNEMTVLIRDFDGSSVVTEYKNENNITAATGESLVYFIQENTDGKIRIQFGNDTIGKSLVNANVVEVTYLETKGSDANQVSSFDVNNSIDGWASNLFIISNVVKSVGGADREGIEEIKINAPKNYQTQNRCVTAGDYRAIVLREASNISSINVWGGEDDTPPAYGKLRMALRTTDGSTLTPQKQQDILDIIQQYNIITITPEIITADQIYLDVTTDVSYDYNKTTFRDGDIEGLVTTQISNYFVAELLDFNSTFRYSDFIADIDEADVSILSNATEIMLAKQYTSIVGATSVQLEYNNVITPGTFLSSTWTQDSSKLVYLYDDGLGKLFQNLDGVNYPTSVGTIAYDTGIVSIDSYDFNATNATIRFSVDPADFDIISARKTLLEEGIHNITITRVL